MHHLNDIDDAMNNVIMVISRQQNRRLFLYDFHSRCFYEQFLLRLQAGYNRYIWGAPSL